MKILSLSAEDLRLALPMRSAIEVMQLAFAELSTGGAEAPQRLPLSAAPGNVTFVMPALLPGALGAKLVSVFPENAGRGKAVVNGIVLALDPETGEPAALCDGAFLTAWRTGAASGAATDLLARGDARRAALFGCGAQARTQALAIDTVRELEEVRVYARTRAPVDAFVTEMAPRLRARLTAAASPEDALRGVDVVCTATTSRTPVFDGHLLEDGAHLNGVGSFTLEMREVDGETVRRARIFVDRREAALAEAGDLVAAVREGVTEPGDWAELGEVVAGTRPGRQSDREITFFKSVGNAVQDVAALGEALRRAREMNLGSMIEL